MTWIAHWLGAEPGTSAHDTEADARAVIQRKEFIGVKHAVWFYSANLAALKETR